MEKPLHAIIALHGIKTIAKVIKMKNLEGFEPLVDTVRLAHQMQLDGCAL